METPNIQLYNFLRYDFNLNDIKSLEFMHILDKEYKSNLRDDFAALHGSINEGFKEMRDQFHIQNNHIVRLDNRIDQNTKDLQAGLADVRKDMQIQLLDVRKDMHFGLNGLRSDLRIEIKDSKIDTIRWVIALFLALATMILATWLKK